MATEKDVFEERYGMLGLTGQYPSPFFDSASFYMPTNIKTAFKYCEYYFHNNSIILQSVSTMALYPITKLIFDTHDNDIWEIYNKIYNKGIKIKKSLVEAGLNYFVFGNAFITIMFPFRRWLICPECAHAEIAVNIPKNKAPYYLQWQNWEYKGTCPKCKKMITFRREDKIIEDPMRVKVVNFSPKDITIKYNDITDESIYYYSIPEEIKRRILSGERDVIDTTPWLYIESLKEKKMIKLFPDAVYHLKRVSISGRWRPWGFPFIYAAFKSLYHLQIMLKAREKLYNQHIVPLWVFYPTAVDQAIPQSTIMNLQDWSRKVDDEIKKWRKNQNYIVKLPIPMGFQFIGADFKSLNISPEIDQMETSIAVSSGVPIEFIRGGVNWTGMGIGLRLLQNAFMNYREDMMGLIDFIHDKVRARFDLADIPVRMEDMKLADDFQRKDALMNLNASNKISDDTLFTELGLETEKEYKAIEDETVKKEKLMKKAAKVRAEIESVVSNIQQEYMIKQQQQAQKFQNMQIIDPEATSDLLADNLLYFQNNDQEKYDNAINYLQENMPNMMGLVQEKMQAKQKKYKSRPQPEQKPPRRKGSTV